MAKIKLPGLVNVIANALIVLGAVGAIEGFTKFTYNGHKFSQNSDFVPITELTSEKFDKLSSDSKHYARKTKNAAYQYIGCSWLIGIGAAGSLIPRRRR